MVTDYYPSEEGYICDGNVIGFAKVQAAIELHEVVYVHGTNVSEYVSVAPAAADGDGCAVALKAGAAGDYIPVAFFGVIKMKVGAAIAENDQVINDSLGTYILPLPTYTHDEMTALKGLTVTGSVMRLGVALQRGPTSGDEILVLVGRII